MAAAIVVASLVGIVALAALYWSGFLTVLRPPGGPAADAVPLYVLLGVVGVGLVLWGWKRVLSMLE